MSIAIAARWMVDHRLLLAAVFVILTAVCFPLALNIPYDRTIQSFFDPDHPLLNLYQKVESEFGGDSICVVVYEDESLLSPEGMSRLAGLGKRLLEVEGVRGVTSLADLRRPSLATVPKTLLDWFRSERVSPEQLADEIVSTYIYSNQFVGNDRKTAAILVLLDSRNKDSSSRNSVVANLRRVIDVPPYRGQIVGAPVLLNDFFDKIEEDAWTLTTVSIAMMALVVFALFRNLRWVLLPLMVIFSTWVWMRAGVRLLSLDLGFTASLSTALISVIGMATTIHIAVRYREELAIDDLPEEALTRSFEKVLPAIFWTCATTAIGFGSLIISRVAPVRDFGIVMAAASMLVGVACFLILPGGVLLGRGSTVPAMAPGERQLSHGLEEVESLVVRYSWVSAGLAVLAIAFAGIGMFWLVPETDFTKNFRGDSPILAGYQFAEERLDGAGLLGLSFDAPQPLTHEFLARVSLAQNELRQLAGVTKVIGLADFIDLSKGSLPPFMQSESPLALAMVLKTLQREMPKEIEQVWNEADGRLRIILRVRERDTAASKQILLDSIRDVGQTHLGDSAQPTGLYVLLVYLMDSLLGDQWFSFAASSLGALASLSLAFRSFRLGIAAFIPNLIPIVAVVGLMGWIGLKVNAATAMIQSISMGLAVDFSIHYIYRFVSERRRGVPFAKALSNTHASTGKSMVFASIALMLGFGVLAFSNFLPTMQFGLLVSLAMLGGLVGNLVLLPVLITWLCPARLRASWK